MHDLYYKGRIHTRKNFVKSGYDSKRISKLGTEESPLTLVVASQTRFDEIDELVKANQLFANITIEADGQENIVELDTILNKPTTTTFDKKQNRNDPCSCGSGKKFKKCCG
ncbi:MAG: SEC-C domain-containing protein [Gammaproteobacteria bacterium]|nr:SEC-C domain-containing protein [Gammaproteobacteria bacterium]